MKRLTKKMITLLLTLFVITITGILLSLWANHTIMTSSKPFWVDDINEAKKLKAVLILGAKVYKDGNLSIMLSDRVDTAISLYQNGKADKILVSGDHRKESYDEVNAMREYILNKNIPAQDIFLDHAGFRTYDSLYRAKEVFKLSSFFVVTQAFHLDRAIYLGRQLGLDVYGIPADKREYLYHEYNLFREFIARTFAYFEIHLFPHEPKFLGPKINISGDGRVTHDKISH